jgi:hypothetical protein
VKLLDAKTGEVKIDTGQFRIMLPEQAGNPMVPYGVALPINTLAAGAYKLDISGLDSAGKTFHRVGQFQVED